MRQDLPREFTDMVLGFGEAYAGPLLEALSTPPAVSVRANILKHGAAPTGADTVPWLPQGFYLPERPLFASDPAWHQGMYYVQDASSMIYTEAVRRVVNQYYPERTDLRYLDACAAPGGKTISAIEALPAGCLVIANEYDRHRANILLENLTKCGAPAVAVCRGDAAKLGKLRDTFDIIAVDAPCSGEGMMRKEPEAIRQWSHGLIDECAAMQRHIVDALWKSLKPGGVMIYSTCTFNRTENEEMLAYLTETLDAKPVDLHLTDFPGVQPGINCEYPCWRLAPGHVRGEGLFICAVHKPGESSGRPGKTIKPRPAGEFAQAHIDQPEVYTEISTPGGIELRPSAHASIIADIAAQAELLRGGLLIATAKGRDLAPSHQLAMSTALRRGSFPEWEVDYASAMSYLRGESLTDIPDDLPKGYVLLTYAGSPLGFAKNIGRRANNLYPDAMRLRLDPRTLPAQPTFSPTESRSILFQLD